MATEVFREILTIIRENSNEKINPISAQHVLEEYCKKLEITAEEFCYAHAEGLKDYEGFKELSEKCGDVQFRKVEKGLEKMINEHRKEIDNYNIKKELYGFKELE